MLKLFGLIILWKNDIMINDPIDTFPSTTESRLILDKKYSRSNDVMDLVYYTRKLHERAIDLRIQTFEMQQEINKLKQENKFLLREINDFEN